jgi:hypothetical protein
VRLSDRRSGVHVRLTNEEVRPQGRNPIERLHPPHERGVCEVWRNRQENQDYNFPRLIPLREKFGFLRVARQRPPHWTYGLVFDAGHLMRLVIPRYFGSRKVFEWSSVSGAGENWLSHSRSVDVAVARHSASVPKNLL